VTAAQPPAKEPLMHGVFRMLRRELWIVVVLFGLTHAALAATTITVGTDRQKVSSKAD